MKSPYYDGYLQDGYCLMLNTLRNSFNAAMHICFLDELKEVAPAIEPGERMLLPIDILATMKGLLVRRIGVSLLEVSKTIASIGNLNPQILDNIEWALKPGNGTMQTGKVNVDDPGSEGIDMVTVEDDGIENDAMVTNKMKSLEGLDRRETIKALDGCIHLSATHIEYFMSQLYKFGTYPDMDTEERPYNTEDYYGAESLCDDVNVQLLAGYRDNMRALENFISDTEKDKN